MASSSSSAAAATAAAAAAIQSVPWSTLSPHAAPYMLRARPVGTPPPGGQQDGDDSRLIDDNSMTSSAYFGMKPCSTVYPASAHGTHQSQPSSSSGIHVNAYLSSASSTSGYTWMASDLKQEQFPLTSENRMSANKSTKVIIKCPPNRTSETNNISFGSKSKLAIRENDDCNNEAGKDISFCRNLELSNPANDNGSSHGTMELNPVLKPLCIPSTRSSSRVSAADDVNPDPSDCSVDSPCWRGALATRASSLDVLQTSDARPVKQELVNFDVVKCSSVQDHESSTDIEKLVASKSKQTHSHPRAGLGLSEKPVDVDTNLKKDSHGKEIEHAESAAGKCNAEDTYCLEVRNNCMKQSGLNIAAPDFIPSSVRKSSSGNGLPSSIIPHGSSSSTARNTSEILKAIKIQSDMLLNNYSDDNELEECDLSIIESIIENLQSYHYKARKGPAKVGSDSDKAGLKSCHSQNAVSKSVAVNRSGTCTADKGKGIIVSNGADYSHSPDDFGRNSLTGYQPAPNLWKELSYKDEHSQVLIFKNLWIDAERANCALKYQLKQILMKIEQESSMAHSGGGPRNPSSQLFDMVTDPSSSVGLASTCPPMLKDYPEARKSPDLIYVGDCTHSGDNNVLSRSKDYVPKYIQGEHFLSDLDETGIRCGLQLVPNKSHMGLNSSISDGVSSHSYITRMDDILTASCEFGLSDWEHVLKNEIA